MSRLHYGPFVGTGGRLQLETPPDAFNLSSEDPDAPCFILVEFDQDGLSVDEVDEDTAALAVANVPGFSMQGVPSAPSGKGRSKKSPPPTEVPAEPTPEAPAEHPATETPAETPASEPVASDPESATTSAEPAEAAVPAEGGSETTHTEGDPAPSAEPAQE